MNTAAISPKTRILGTGRYAPSKVVSNHDLEKVVDTSDAWITERTGIKQRHVAADGEVTSDMAAAAGRAALEAAGLNVADLDLIIVGTVTPDSPMPSCASQVQQKLGADEIPAFDISAACAGFIYGVTIADQFIRNGSARCVLVIGVELLSRILNWGDRTTCVLFGDGAGAVVLGPSKNNAGILSTQLFTDGSLAGALHIPAGGSAEPHSAATIAKSRHKVHMSGSEVFKTAVKNLTAASSAAVKSAGLKSTDIDWVVAHQANMRILDQVATRLGFPLSRFVLNIADYGNTSSASIPIALDEAVRAGKVRRGDVVLMAAFGAGLTWAASAVRW
jgi:3-oxoacyl-[acyl-carrier-protein] synthase-3